MLSELTGQLKMVSKRGWSGLVVRGSAQRRGLGGRRVIWGSCWLPSSEVEKEVAGKNEDGERVEKKIPGPILAFKKNNGSVMN